MMEEKQNDNLMTFGEHLEVLRKMLFRIIGITLCLAIGIFCAKDTTFQLLLAPGDNHFITYRLIESGARGMGWNFHFEPYTIQQHGVGKSVYDACIYFHLFGITVRFSIYRDRTLSLHSPGIV